MEKTSINPLVQRLAKGIAAVGQKAEAFHKAEARHEKLTEQVEQLKAKADEKSISSLIRVKAELEGAPRRIDDAAEEYRQTSQVSAESYSDAAVAVAAMATAMKELRGFTKNVTDNLDINITKLDEQFAATEKLIEAEAELAKAKLDRDEPDPVKRAKAKAAIDDTLAGTKLGLAGKKGQQAALVEKQRLQERQLQIDAVAEVPTRENLVACVSAFETDRANLEEAKNANRQSFGKAELLRRFVRDGNSPDFFKTFDPSDIEALQDMGVVSGLSGSLKDGVLGGEPNRPVA